MSPVADQVKHGEPIAISDNRFAVDQKRASGQCRYGGDNEWKARAEIVAVAGDEADSCLSRRAMMRKPSCLISCSQSGPEGGALAGDAKHGSIMPSPGRVRSRNILIAAS